MPTKNVKSHLDVTLYVWMGRQIACLLMISVPKNDNDDSLHIPGEFAFSFCDSQLDVFSFVISPVTGDKRVSISWTNCSAKLKFVTLGL